MAWDDLATLYHYMGALSGTEFKLLFEMLIRERGGGHVRVSLREMQKSTGITRSQIRRSLHALEEKHLILDLGAHPTRAKVYRLLILELSLPPLLMVREARCV